MKLQQLRFLDAVVRNNLNVSSAATELYTSQPGVSHQIKLLEDELDIQIFERSGKKLTAISPAGLEPRVAFTATDSDVIKTYVRLGMGAGIIAEMACRDEDSDLVYIDASHLFPDSVIKVGFRHSRHISACQFDFLHRVAPYLEMEAIRRIASSRTLQDREKLLAKSEVPCFRDMRNSLIKLKVVG